MINTAKKKLFSKETHHYVRMFSPKKCKKGKYGIDDVGEPGGHVRLSCELKRTKNRWGTQAWRLPKDEYKIVGKELRPKTSGARDVYNRITRKGKKKIVRKGEDWMVK